MLAPDRIPDKHFRRPISVHRYELSRRKTNLGKICPIKLDTYQPMYTDPTLNWSERTSRILTEASAQSWRRNSESVGTGEFLLALLAAGTSSASLLQQAGAQPDTLRAWLEDKMNKPTSPARTENMPFSPRLKICFSLAAEEAEKHPTKSGQTEPEHLLLGIIRDNMLTGKMLKELHIDPNQLTRSLHAALTSAR